MISAIVWSDVSVPSVSYQGSGFTNPPGELYLLHKCCSFFCYKKDQILYCTKISKTKKNKKKTYFLRNLFQAEDCLYLNIFRPHYDTGQGSNSRQSNEIKKSHNNFVITHFDKKRLKFKSF